MTKRDNFILECVKRWVRLRAKERGKEWNDELGNVHQFCADIDHSSLLRRLIAGYEPLPEKPELVMSYPVYPDLKENIWMVKEEKE
jgi:hypothetical protein